MILRTRYPRKAPPNSIVDGTSYEASVWVPGYGTIHGRTHSPDAGLPKEFVELGDALGEFPSSEPAERRGLRAKLLKRLKVLESRV